MIMILIVLITMMIHNIYTYIYIYIYRERERERYNATKRAALRDQLATDADALAQSTLNYLKR